VEEFDPSDKVVVIIYSLFASLEAVSGPESDGSEAPSLHQNI
jgi:hypothetical protein